MSIDITNKHRKFIEKSYTGEPLKCELHVIKKKGGVYYRPDCDLSARLIKELFRKKLFNEQELKLLEDQGYKIIRKVKIPNYNLKDKVLLEAPNFTMSYSYKDKCWKSWWKAPATGEILGHIIHSKTKKEAYVALLRTGTINNINNL